MVAAGKRLATVLEAALPITDQFADRLGVDVAVPILAWEAERGVAGFFFQALELARREWRQEYVVILALALVALSGLGRDEPGAFFQIDMAPFGFEQFSNTAEGTQADPDGALHARIDRTDAGVFLAGGEGVVVALQSGEDVAQLSDFIRRE